MPLVSVVRYAQPRLKHSEYTGPDDSQRASARVRRPWSNACLLIVERMLPEKRIPGNSFNHLVGAGEQRRRHVEAERMRRGETPGIRDGWRSD